jgi:hypothetical protein
MILQFISEPPAPRPVDPQGTAGYPSRTFQVLRNPVRTSHERKVDKTV